MPKRKRQSRGESIPEVPSAAEADAEDVKADAEVQFGKICHKIVHYQFLFI